MSSKNRKATAYCGLYCEDCIPSNRRLFTLVKELEQLLDTVKFENYAKLKAKRSEVFNRYKDFTEVLSKIKKLECIPTCYNGPKSELGCSNKCIIRECVINKRFEGCWECDLYKSCEKLERHKIFHPNTEHNLNMIKEFGINNWVDKRGKHYKWDD